MERMQQQSKVVNLVAKANGRALNLQKQYIDRFWITKNKEQSGIASRLREMDAQEYWTVDEAVQIQTPLAELAKVLSDIKEINDEAFVSPEQIELFLTTLTYLKSSYAFRIINWLDENRNSVMIKLVIHALESAENGIIDSSGHITPAGMLLERMSALHVLGMIQEIFNPEATNLIKKTLKEFEEKDGGGK